MAEMTREEVYAWLDDGPPWARLATNGRNGFPHLVPLNYFRHGDEVVVNLRGQREVNLRRNQKVALLIDSGLAIPELKGVMITGEATIVDDPEGCLELVRAGERKRGVPEDQLPTEARPGRNFARIPITDFVSWDNAKR